MADRLTQIQDAVNDFATQCVSALYYINKHHDVSKLGPSDTVRVEKKNEGEDDQAPEVTPLDPEVFKEAQRELARDLVLKEQQIELLITLLPGLTHSEEEQESTIWELEEKLKIEEAKRKQAVKDRDEILAKLEKVIRSVQRP